MKTQVATKIQKNQVIKLGDKPMVILPLEKWEAAKKQIEYLEEELDDMECAKRFDEALNDPDNQETYAWEDIKKEMNL